jgi:hypothetical protein
LILSVDRVELGRRFSDRIVPVHLTPQFNQRGFVKRLSAVLLE